jgi:hypothetical protein
MELSEFAVTYDYRCPFARNAHEHVVSALRSGAPWQVEFVPFSLSQVHVEEGGPPVWDNPKKKRDLLAIEASIAVRDLYAERFMEVHLALFAARHDQARDLRDEEVIRDVLTREGVDADRVFEAVEAGGPGEEFRKAHERSVAEHNVFGVPTFVVGNQAVFVRIMTRPTSDAGASRAAVERILTLLAESPELNEFKHTSISN